MPNKNSFDNIPYAQWLEKSLKDLIAFPVKGICIAATSTDGATYVNYHNISMADKLVISGIINQDAMLDTMAANGIVEYADEESVDGEEKEC